MKRRFLATLCLCLCLIGNTATAFAADENNHQDSTLPYEFIGYLASADTIGRKKMDDSSVYIESTTAFDLKVVVMVNSKVNCTYKGYAIVPKAKRLIHNTVYEEGYTSCYLRISAADSGETGMLTGKWSPDSVGSYPYANPF